MNKEKRKIKLVIVINDFLVGGAQRLIIELLRYLDRSRFDVVLVTLMQFEGKETMYHLLPKDIQIRKLNFRGFADIKSWTTLWKLLRKERPDVVLSHLFFSNTVARILNIFTKYKTITVEHNTYEGNKKWQVWSDHILSRFSQKIVAVSTQVMEFAYKQQRISREKFVVIKNGIDVEAVAEKASSTNALEVRGELGVEPATKLIIMVGRLTGQKEPILLIDGFAGFAHSHSNYHLAILGDGALRIDMEKRVKDLDIGNQVHFLGNVSDIHRYYGVAEFLVSTSRIEGLSMAHLEALSCGVPILATHTAGSEELIEEGKNGLFISNRTPQAIEDGFVRMIERDMLALHQGARETAKNYDIWNTVSQYEKLISSV